MKSFASSHSRTAEEVFARPAFTGDGPVFDTPLFLLAFTNRCGSNYLAELLRNSGHFGTIGELLNAESLVNQQRQHGFESLADYIGFLYGRLRAPQGQFGVKASAEQIAMLHHFGILRMFPETRVIHITRADVVEQAVSFSIAFQTKQWTSLQTPETTEVRYDYDDILKRLQAVTRENQRILEISAVLGLPLCSVQYENLARQPRGQLRRVLRFAGIPVADLKPGRTRLEKQASELNAEFCARFRAEYLQDTFGAGD